MSIRHGPTTEWNIVEVYRCATPQERVRAAFDWQREIQHAQANSIRARTPHADLARELRRRLMPRALFARLENHAAPPKETPMSLMMKHEQVVEQVLAVLEDLQIQYMLVGGITASFWGRSRVTRDADIVVALRPRQAARLVDALGADYFIEPNELAAALRARTFFLILHRPSGFSLHLLLRKGDPFHRAEFRRRKRLVLFARPAYINAPEDAILSKLLWFKQLRRDRDYTDALEMFEIQEPSLNQKYLEEWAKRLKLMPLLAKIRRQAARPPETIAN